MPDRLIIRALLFRGTVMWVGIRAMLALVSLARHLPRAPATLRLAPGASVFLVAIVAMLAWVDAENRNETRLIANLGVAPWTITLLGALPAALAEIAIAIAAIAHG